MKRRPLGRFLLSGDAIQVHLLCLTLVVVLTISLLTGEAQPDYAWGLVFTVVVYPILLGLLWWYDRLDERAAVEHVIESLTAPERLLRKRRRWRSGVLCVVFVLAAWLTYAGHHGLRLDTFPAQYLGYFLLAVAVLGAAGVNIWHGGPLDLRLDPVVQEEEVQAGRELDPADSRPYPRAEQND